jgi:hypothetical protein
MSIYEAVVEALERCGEFRIHAQKTRIAFISRMSFAGVSVARARGVEYSASLQRVGDATWVTIDPGVGLGAGDNTDLYLRVDL